MKKLSKDRICYVMSRETAPVLQVRPGETFCVETEDAYGGTIKASGDLFPGAVRPNPATGPVYVEGSEPRDVLRVDIERIEIPDQGVMATPETKILPIKAGKVFLRADLSVPISPMIGVIGTAPQLEPVPNTTPGKHGGNMDCKQIGEGCSVYLPVNVEGALLALGDVHAQMGDGEVCGCGVEVAATVTLRAWVYRSVLPTPCVATPDSVAFIGSALTLDECEDIVVGKAHLFLTDWLNLNEKEALRIMSVVGELRVCQVVDPLKTMRFVLPRSVLEPLGFNDVKAFEPRD